MTRRIRSVAHLSSSTPAFQGERSQRGRGGTNHGSEDGGGGEERAGEALLHPDGDGERGDGGRVRRRHPAGPDQLLRVPPVLLVPADPVMWSSDPLAARQDPRGGGEGGAWTYQVVKTLMDCAMAKASSAETSGQLENTAR